MMASWLCSSLRTIFSPSATRMSPSTRLPLGLALWPRMWRIYVSILDLGDLKYLDVVVSQCAHCLGFIPFYFAELPFLTLDYFAVLLLGLLGGWPWTWRLLCVLLLFSCHFGRGVQFTFWHFMHFRVRRSSSSSSSTIIPYSQCAE